MIRRVNPFERNGCLLDEGPGGRDPEGVGMLDRLLGMISLDNPDGGSGYLSFLKWRRVRCSFFGFEDGLYWGLSGGRGRRMTVLYPSGALCPPGSFYRPPEVLWKELREDRFSGSGRSKG